MKVYLWFVYWLGFLAHKSRIWIAWSTIYRLFKHANYVTTNPISRTQSLEEVNDSLARLAWRGDGFAELGDAIGSPYWVQYCINEMAFRGKQPEGALDCDDFAIYACHALSGHPQTDSQKSRPILAGIWWSDGLAIRGHAICIYQMNSHGKSHYYNISNWGLSGPFESIEEVSNEVFTRYCLSRSNRTKKNKLIGTVLYEFSHNSKAWLDDPVNLKLLKVIKHD